MRYLLAALLLLLLFSSPALAIGKEAAEARVKAVDPKARKARQFWVYPEGEGAWVFYGTGYNSDKALFRGGFWYVTEDDAYPLGDYTENVFEWDWLDCEPPVFYSNTHYQGEHHPHAAILKDGAPFEIKDLGRLIDLDVCFGSLVGLTERDAGAALEYVFLGVQDDRLVEIAAMEISEAEARQIDGMDGILSELATGDGVNPGGVTANGFLFRNAVPGRFRTARGHVQGSIALCVDDRGQPGWVYAFIDADGVAHAMRGWENEIAIDRGAPAAQYGVGLEIIETVTE